MLYVCSGEGVIGQKPILGPGTSVFSCRRVDLETLHVYVISVCPQRCTSLVTWDYTCWLVRTRKALKNILISRTIVDRAIAGASFKYMSACPIGTSEVGPLHATAMRSVHGSATLVTTGMNAAAHAIVSLVEPECRERCMVPTSS